MTRSLHAPLSVNGLLLVLGLGLLFLLPTWASAQTAPEFPELTGRVVDEAGMLDPALEAQLTQNLAAHEQATGEQVVVVTVPNLQGNAIEEYGYQLGRHWGIGQAEEDTGALLIVAEEERQVRIEVGYGLEGRLTDAASSTIINGIIVPAFRQGDFAGGIRAGVSAMIQVLGGQPLATPTRAAGQMRGEKPSLSLASLFFLVMMGVIYFIGGGRGRRGRGRGGAAAFLGGAMLGGMGRGGGGFGGGGFGGGGGGFGGGGASGGW